MGLIGKYTLHLYCDHAAANGRACTEWPGEYIGHTKDTAKAQAKQKGWVFKPGYAPANETLGSPFAGACYCPTHSDDIPNIKSKVLG